MQNQFNKSEDLWSIEDLIQNYPKSFPTKNSVRHLIRNGALPIVRFTPRGKIYFSPSTIAKWIKQKSDQGMKEYLDRIKKL